MHRSFTLKISQHGLVPREISTEIRAALRYITTFATIRVRLAAVVERAACALAAICRCAPAKTSALWWLIPAADLIRSVVLFADRALATCLFYAVLVATLADDRVVAGFALATFAESALAFVFVFAAVAIIRAASTVRCATVAFPGPSFRGA
jgi:hypothetical protein